MNYEAPKITVIGTFAEMTLGKWAPGPHRDNAIWWDWLGDPGSR